MFSSFQRAVLLIAALLVAGASAWFATGLSIEQDNLSMQSDEARNDTVYKTFQEAFDSDYELMVAVTRDNLATQAGRQQLQQDAEWLAHLDGVREVHLPARPDAAPGQVSEDGKTI
ncbi:MAG: hypothetical protein JXR25_11665, partial [Pontiellaceae bacterium]|nr:hypothetical protein [Pontiellaceae bacterium]